MPGTLSMEAESMGCEFIAGYVPDRQFLAFGDDDRNLLGSTYFNDRGALLDQV